MGQSADFAKVEIIPGNRAKTVTILIPVFNDWEPVELLVSRIGACFASYSLNAHILLVDDASTVPMPDSFAERQLSCIRSVEILHLRRNLGHQRAIAIGLYQVHESYPTDAVVVMDGDGEDVPEDIVLLLGEFNRGQGKEVVFAERTKRMESVLFRIFYYMFCWSHYLFTGIKVRVGNFSVLPPLALKRLMVVSELWNHYAAAIFRAHIPFRTLPLSRGKRLMGESRMHFFSLVVHGLSAMSVFRDEISARVLLYSLATGAIVLGWLSVGVPLASLIVTQALILAVLLILVIIGNRSSLGFLAVRDAPFFILSITQIFLRGSVESEAEEVEMVGHGNR